MEPHEQRQAHLSAEAIVELVERGRQCPRYEEYIEHIVKCPTCRETYKQLLAAEATVRVHRRSVRVSRVALWMPLAAAALLLLVVGVRALLSSPVESVGLRQANGVWYEGATRLPEWAFALAAQFERPPAPVRDAPRNQAATMRLIQPNPANTALETLTPEFEWTPAPEATRYRAILESVDGIQRFDLSVEGNRASLPSKAALQAGKTYRLTLEALAAEELPGEGLKSVYEFRTLTSQEQSQLRWARTHRKQAPRACVVVFYQLGLYTEAIETLNTLPTTPITQQWREALQSRVIQD
ncbi:MAG: hypothetical protein ACK4RG_06785 [Fimbriimonadales bacterium]